MYKPIRKADLIIGGTSIKQGEIFTLGFELRDAEGLIVVPTAGQVVSVKIANKLGVIYETVASVVGDHIEFTVAENLGYGKLNVELKVTDGANVLQKYPANGFISLHITSSLDDVDEYGLAPVTADAMIARISVAEDTANEAATFAQTEGTRAKQEADRLVGTDVSSLDAKINTTNQQLAEKAQQSYVVAELSTKATKAELSNVLDGTPKGTYATLALLQAAYPTGTTGVYIVTENGHIYSWSGSAWVDRGVYQAVGIATSAVKAENLNPDVKGFIVNSIADVEVETEQMYLAEGNKVAAFGGVNDGTFVWDNVSSSNNVGDSLRSRLTYVDLPEGTPFSKKDISKILRFNYLTKAETGSALAYSYFAKSIDTTQKLMFGVWVRKGDIQNLPSASPLVLSLTLRRTGGTTEATTLTFTKAEAQIVGTTKTGVAGIVTATAQIVEIYGDWVFIKCSTDQPLDGQYRISLNFRVSTLGDADTGKLDLLNYTFIAGGTSIHPHFVYKTTTQTAPKTMTELITDVSTLDDRFLSMENLTGSLVGATKVIKSDRYLFIRTPWDSANDLVQKVDMLSATPDEFDNPIVNFIDYRLVDKTKTDEEIPTATMTAVKTSTDDATPSHLNGTAIGGNHGGSYVRSINATAHGKTVVDVGSEWKDGTNQKFYIMRIVDANNLWVMSENVAVDDWTFLFISGTTLTHSLNATNTAPITIASVTNEQLVPSVKNQTKRIMLDGKIEVVNDGIYTCEKLDIINSYDIVDIADVVTFVKSKVGSSVQPSFVDASISSIARMGITYRFDQYASCVIFQNFLNYKNLTFDEFLSFIQSGPVIIPSGGTLRQYIPKTLPVIVGGVTFNFKQVADITTVPETFLLTTDTWEDLNSPPDRFVQYAKDSGGNKNRNFGFTLGFCPEFAAGKPSVRKSATTSAMMMSSVKKTYPRVISEGTVYPNDIMPANTNIEVVAFRNAVNYNLDPQATNLTWYTVGNAIYLMMDYHVNVNKTVRLPDKFIGKKIEVLEKNSDFILRSEFVNPDGISFQVNNGYGCAVLKLT